MFLLIAIVLIALYFGGRYKRKLYKMEYKKQRNEEWANMFKENKARAAKLNKENGPEYVKYQKKFKMWALIEVVAIPFLVFLPLLAIPFILFGTVMAITNAIKAEKAKKKFKGESK